MAVLDWSGIRSCSADGLAFFLVIVRALRAIPVRVIVCAPDDGDIALALERGRIREACHGSEWLECKSGPARRLDVLATATVFGGSLGADPARAFMRNLNLAVSRIDVTPTRSRRLLAVTMELLQNVLTHAGAEHACAIALFRPRKRPPEIELGIADGGRGIPAGVLAQRRHASLWHLSDASVTGSALTQALSGRATEAGGGCLTDLVRALVSECEATITVRSGAGLVKVAPGNTALGLERFAYGWGTQTLVRLRIAP